MNFNIDTKLMLEAGNDMNLLINQLNDKIVSIYDQLININQKTWKGQGADDFANDALSHKIDAVEFINKLREYSKYLIDTAEKFDVTINNSRR